ALPPRPDDVCHVCWEGPFAAQLDLLKGPHRSDGGYSYSISRANLESGAVAGCVWCKLILPAHNDLLDVPQRPDDELLEDVQGLEVEVTVGRSRSDLAMGPNAYQELLVIINSFPGSGAILYANADDPAAAYISGRPPLLDVGSPRALTHAKECLDECVHEHKHHGALSQTPHSKSPLPTRLIDCTDPKRPRSASTVGKSGKYVALSYVWGQDQPHKTTKANLSAYTREMDPALLPPSIRDAIYVTPSLGLHLLWVDTLCIIQDSDEDKVHELGQMHNIYRNAYLTIIAANARSVSGGFLQQRTIPESQLTLPFICAAPSLSPAPEVKPNETTPRVGQIYLTDPHYFNKTVGFWGDADRDPIKARAWCLQEYMMSSQTLQYRCSTSARNVGRGYLDLRGARLAQALLPYTPAVEPHSEKWAQSTLPGSGSCRITVDGLSPSPRTSSLPAAPSRPSTTVYSALTIGSLAHLTSERLAVARTRRCTSPSPGRIACAVVVMGRCRWRRYDGELLGGGRGERDRGSSSL
ncbi:heterokaryon incompatibility protein-domain-containing protein, partial [Lenzites betulinus]